MERTKSIAGQPALEKQRSHDGYEEALMTTMLSKMNSAVAQKMRTVVESERQLMLEQQQREEPEPLEGESSDEVEPSGGGVPLDMEEYMKQRAILLQQSESEHFSRDIVLDKQELNAQQKLQKLRDEMLAEDPSLVTGLYYDKYQKLKASKLYEALHMLPKPAVHHAHLTAAAPVDYLLKLTYYDYVYYSEREGLFKVTKKGVALEGFQKTTTLRKYWERADEFDAHLREKILLSRKDGECQESHQVWMHFQPKFMLTLELYNYAEFFEKILFKVCKVFVKQLVFVLELRHIFGMVIDDDGKPVGVVEEMAIFHRVLEKIKRDYPLFQLKLIICGLKIIGEAHVKLQIGFMREAMLKSDLLVGFDMVNEEDFCQPLKDFLKLLFDEARAGGPLPLVFHAGESVDAANDNLFDAILLGTKRIGHGFNLALHPHLQELVKQRQICIECCPVSNLVLGYTLDLRCHPVRAFLHQGIPVSISPDDPCFFDYEGVTLDYVYAFLAWELDLADLKKLALNSLEFASISAAEKAQLLPLFNTGWKRFCEFIRSKY